MPHIHHRATRIRQDGVTEAINAPQSEEFFDSQLTRAITLALSAVGFDSVKPSALEAFRAEVEQYILHFLAIVSSHMHSSRRLTPIPQDFIFALAHLRLTPSQLLPHLTLRLPPGVVQPSILPAPTDDPPQTRLEPVLGPELASLARPTGIPEHLPPLPSRHTYRSTSILPQRESDARKIRERATAEGVLAEQAMRKLLRKGGQGRVHIPFSSDKAQGAWEDVARELGELDERQRGREEEEEYGIGDLGMFEGKGEDGVGLGAGVIVNYERRFWRRGAQG